MIGMPRSAERGFTLVELMVVVALIAILTALAVAYTGEARPNLKSFAGAVAGECDAARMRAIASRKWQRVWFDVDSELMVVDQATTTGMAEPTDWVVMNTFKIPKQVHLASIHTTADAAGGVLVTDGDGLDEALAFAPDGSSVPRTVYLTTNPAKSWVRVVVYRATGTAYVKEAW